MIFAIFAVLVILFVVLPVIGMALWAVISTVIVGLVLGALARLVLPGSQPIGFLRTVGAGLCGSILGGFLGQHVLHLFWFATLLLEIAIAAVFVVLLAGRSGRVGVDGPR